MDMHEARDIAVRFLGGLPVSDDAVFEAGNLIRDRFREDGLVPEDLDRPAGAVALADDDADLDQLVPS